MKAGEAKMHMNSFNIPVRRDDSRRQTHVSGGSYHEIISLKNSGENFVIYIDEKNKEQRHRYCLVGTPAEMARLAYDILSKLTER